VSDHDADRRLYCVTVHQVGRYLLRIVQDPADGVTYFGLFKIPPMASPNKVLYDFFQGVHENTAYVLMVILIVHILAALYHLLFVKDGVFQRMLPGR
jgi:cytochrome b561